MSEGVSFRRIRGRIVPIKVSKEHQAKRDVAHGAALSAAGLGVAASGGLAYKKIFKMADSAADKSNYFASEFQRVRNAAMKASKAKKTRKSPAQLGFGDMGASGFARSTPKKMRLATQKHAARALRLGLGAKATAFGALTLAGYMATKGFEKTLNPLQDKSKGLANTPIEFSASALGSALTAGAFGLSSGVIKRKEIFRALKTAAKIKKKF